MGDIECGVADRRGRRYLPEPTSSCDFNDIFEYAVANAEVVVVYVDRRASVAREQVHDIAMF